MSTTTAAQQSRVKKWTEEGLRVFKGFCATGENLKSVQITIASIKPEEFKEPLAKAEVEAIATGMVLTFQEKMTVFRSVLIQNHRDLRISFTEKYHNGEEKTYYLRSYADVEKRTEELQGKAEILFWPGHFGSFEEWMNEFSADVKPETAAFKNKLLQLVRDMRIEKKVA